MSLVNIVKIDGVTLYVDTNGRVYRMSDWARCWEFASKGFLKTKNYGPATYGHTDFFVKK